MTSLAELTCFSHIKLIKTIDSGLSSQSYQVYADDKVYFAKKLTTNDESRASEIAASQHFSPDILYCDHQWLITQFINGEALSTSHHSIDEKILISLKLMVQCHQLDVQVATLEPKVIINELIDNASLPNSEKETFLLHAKKLFEPITFSKNLVCCHGDLNFSNVLTCAHNSWVIDFECVCKAPAEYDLAMFIAVNNIASNRIPLVIKQYQSLSPSLIIDTKQLSYFLCFSYFINSLWYKNAYQNQNPKEKDLLDLYKQQWGCFIDAYNEL